MSEPASPVGAIDAWKSIFRLQKFIRPHRGAIGFGLLFLFLQAAAKLAKPWPLKFAFDNILTNDSLDRETTLILVGVASLVVVIAAVDGLLNYLLALVLNKAGRTVVFDVRVALFERIHNVSLQFHARSSAGDLMTRLTSDVKALRVILTESVAQILNSAIFMFGMALLLFWLDWQLALVAYTAAPFLFLTVRYFTPQVRAFSRAERKREGQLSEVVHESLGTMRLSRVFNQEQAVKDRFEEESGASLQFGVAAALKAERVSWIVDVLGATVTAAVLGFGVKRVMDNAITPGDLIVFVSYIRDFWKPMRTSIKHTTKLARASAQIDRVVELLDEDGGVVDQPDAVSAPEFQGALAFNDVTFDYDGGQSVLKGVNLSIAAGEGAAIVGPTGVGKSTLLSLIPRLYDPSSGSIEIDGTDIRAFTLSSLRSQISVVMQESVLLRTSIAENIAYGKPTASRPEIVDAAKKANAHDFIRALPEGYDTTVGERGETLSGGQRQRIAIARAIIRDAPILILDEPLVGLDSESGAAVLDALRELMRGKTVLVITHQLAMIGDDDRVIVLDGGTVVQDGLHRELITQSGKYQQMIDPKPKHPKPVEDAQQNGFRTLRRSRHLQSSLERT